MLLTCNCRALLSLPLFGFLHRVTCFLHVTAQLCFLFHSLLFFIVLHASYMKLPSSVFSSTLFFSSSCYMLLTCNCPALLSLPLFAFLHRVTRFLHGTAQLCFLVYSL